MPRDYYVVLGVSRGADLNKIKQAYRNAVKRHHPDSASGTGSTDKFIEAKDAYTTLSNPVARREYDHRLAQEQSSQKKSGPDETFSRKLSYDEHGLFYSAADEFLGGIVPGFFPDFFEKGRGKGKELFLELILTDREASGGGMFSITVPVIVSCPQCSSAGIRNDIFCPHCRGKGRVRTLQELSLSIPPHIHDGAQVSLPLYDIGLASVVLHVTVTIDHSRNVVW